MIEKTIRQHFRDESIQVRLQGSVGKGTGISFSDLDCFVVGAACKELDRQKILPLAESASNERYKGVLGKRRVLLEPADGFEFLPSIDLIFQDLNGKQKRVREPDPISRLGKKSRHMAKIVTRFLKWMPSKRPAPTSLLGGYEDLPKPNHHIEAFVTFAVREISPSINQRQGGGGGVALLLATCLFNISNQEQGFFFVKD